MVLPRYMVPWALTLAWAAIAQAQDVEPPQDTVGASLRLYGFVQADFGYDFRQNNPLWFDVNRPTQLPSFPGEFGKDGRFFAGVRQTRFGVEGHVPAAGSDLHTQFEFDLFGVGADAGQTAMRIRLAYGQWRDFGAGQLNSPFMDGDVFPNTLDYWGPNGMALFRNVQVFYQPIQGDSRLTIALERPGASGDAGIYADRVAIDSVQLRFPLPDLSAEYRWGRPWGYIEGAAIIRYVKLDDLREDQFDLDDHVIGWGLSLSSNVHTTSRDVLRMQVVYGAGVQNYMNDAPQDIAGKNNFSDPVQPIVPRALPLLGLTAFYDRYWSDRWSTTFGYSSMTIDNTDGQEPSAFHRGQYALVNLAHYPVPEMMVGAEFQWARRQNSSDGFRADDYRVQVSFRYSYSKDLFSK